MSGFADGGPPDGEARLVTATCGGVRVSSVYVPNGREVGHDHFHYKLRWLARLRDHVVADGGVTAPRGAVCGDFNVAPDDIDLWSTRAFVGATHVTPERAGGGGRARGARLRDAFREQYPGVDGALQLVGLPGRQLPQAQGHAHRPGAGLVRSRRLDELALVDRNARKGPKPSDHAPLFVDVDVPVASS